MEQEKRKIIIPYSQIANLSLLRQKMIEGKWKQAGVAGEAIDVKCLGKLINFLKKQKYE